MIRSGLILGRLTRQQLECGVSLEAGVVGPEGCIGRDVFENLLCRGNSKSIRIKEETNMNLYERSIL